MLYKYFYIISYHNINNITMSSVLPILSNPYYLVNVSSPYQDYDKYNKNILKLVNDFHILTSTVSLYSKLYVHLTIGAPMEEMDKLEKISCGEQYKQLFPDMFYEILENGYEIIHYIIAPNKSFSDELFEEPTFIEKTKEFKWIKSENIYKSSVFKITVKIFYTMMPTNDFYNNVRIENYRKKGIDVTQFIQTRDDKLFVSSFYLSLSELIKKININNGFVSCFNFAIFRSLEYAETLNNYKMFPELVTCLTDLSNDKFILCKWIMFDETNYLMLSHHNKKQISYNLKKNNKQKFYIKDNSFYFK